MNCITPLAGVTLSINPSNLVLATSPWNSRREAIPRLVMLLSRLSSCTHMRQNRDGHGPMDERPKTTGFKESCNRDRLKAEMGRNAHTEGLRWLQHDCQRTSRPIHGGECSALQEESASSSLSLTCRPGASIGIIGIPCGVRGLRAA